MALVLVLLVALLACLLTVSQAQQLQSCSGGPAELGVNASCCFMFAQPSLPVFVLPPVAPYSPGDVELNSGNPIVLLDNVTASGCNGDVLQYWNASAAAWLSTYTDCTGALQTSIPRIVYSTAGSALNAATIQSTDASLPFFLSQFPLRLLQTCDNGLFSCLQFSLLPAGFSSQPPANASGTCTPYPAVSEPASSSSAAAAPQPASSTSLSAAQPAPSAATSSSSSVSQPAASSSAAVAQTSSTSPLTSSSGAPQPSTSSSLLSSSSASDSSASPALTSSLPQGRLSSPSASSAHTVRAAATGSAHVAGFFVAMAWLLLSAR